MPTTDTSDRPPSPATDDNGTTGTTGNDDAVERPTRPPGPSVKLALIVVGIAALILVVSIVADLATGAGAPAGPPPAPATVKGAGLTAIAATNVLAPLEVQGQPPDDIINAVVVPAGVRAGATLNNSADTGPYDRTIDLSSAASQGALIQFFKVELKSQGWGSESSGPATNAPTSIEVLAKRAGSDGYYWEIGVVVPPTSFGAGSAATGTTRFTLRLFQVSDSQ